MILISQGSSEHSICFAVPDKEASAAHDVVRRAFAGELRDFDLPLDMHGTAFQKRIWQELLNIPYGRTCSYSFVATAVGAPKAVRAVGAANGRNPVPIVVPCHRVIGANGKLTGFGGGLPTKEALLALETRQLKLATGSI